MVSLQTKSRTKLHSPFVILLILVGLLSGIGQGFAQVNTFAAEDKNMKLDRAKRDQIIDTLVSTLRQYYILPDKAEEMITLLRNNQTAGMYDQYTERDPFIGQLTRDLQSVNRDRHLGVWPLEWSLSLGEISAEEKEHEAQIKRYNNYGLPTVTRLPGNIGYLEILDFESPPEAARSCIAALNFLANCDAIVLDVRRCGGGEGYLVQLLLSYFFKEPVEFLRAYTRHTDTSEQIWTMPYVQGPSLVDLPLYVLQSRRTASAAESMCHALQALKRATIVGETSRGAAHMVEELNFLDLSICISVSISDVTSPVTGLSWEKTGVAPDLSCDAEKALAEAARHALTETVKMDSPPRLKQLRQWALEFYQAELEPVRIEDEQWQKICGSYGETVTVRRENGQTRLIQKDREPPLTFVPVGGFEFAAREREVRISFKPDEHGLCAELDIDFANGFKYTYTRTR